LQCAFLQSVGADVSGCSFYRVSLSPYNIDISDEQRIFPFVNLFQNIFKKCVDDLSTNSALLVERDHTAVKSAKTQ